MRSTKLYIENFKSFEKVIINLNNNLNIFTGVNNAGKTTVLESISIWSECFNLLIKQSQKSISDRINKGDYKLGDSSGPLVDYREIISVRSPSFQDIFYNLDTSKKIIIRTTIENNDGVKLDIGFEIKKSSGGTNYKISLENYTTFDFKKFNNFFSKFPNPINVIYASPINSLLPYEEFETLPKINSKIKCRESISILRNRLYQLKKMNEKFLNFLNDLSYILTDKTEPIDFIITGDEYKDVELCVYVKIGGKDIAKGISLLGSGTLQIIEILLSLYEEHNDLHIILLDEPDSHIHRNIQKRLLNILIKHTSDAQIFLTTHNESLIRSSKPEHLFYIEKSASKEYSPIINDTIQGLKIGLQPSKHIKILASLGSENGLDIINALEADKLILVEGKTDAKYIQTIIDKNDPNKHLNVMYWSFDGIENLLPKLKAYKDFFSLIKNGKSLWDKSILVFDSDYTTDTQRNNLMQKIQEQYNIKTYIWKCYTLESTILTNLDEFKKEMYSIINKNSVPTVIDKDELFNYIDTLIDELSKDWLEKLDSGNKTSYCDKISSLIKSRKSKVNDAISGYQVFRDDSLLFGDFCVYSKPLLIDRKIYPIADKKIVKALLRTIFNKYEIDLTDSIDEFEFFINQVTRGEWISEWDNFLDLIK